MNNWDIQYLYPTEVYSAKVENFDAIQDEIQSVIEKSTFDYFSGFGETHKLSQHFEPSDSSYLMGDLPIFNKELQTHIERYGKELKYYNNEYQVANSWITLFERGDYAHIHDHKDADYSGVYYYQKEPSQDFFFESPVVGAKASAPYFGARIYPPTETGHLMLFPGWLLHGVDKIATDGQRYSLSFNIIFQKNDPHLPVIKCHIE